tara:strand:- start:316 stop:801 length:486 start_codon:yes stop_codon:yes gene_type:complete
MDDLFSGSPSAPPQSVVIQDAEPAQPQNQTLNAVTLSGQTSHFQNVAAPQYGYQVPLAAGKKPSVLMLCISILLILFSTVFPFLAIDSFMGDDDLICCLLCNGNAVGFILMGVYCFQYGTWEKNIGKSVSMTFSFIIGILLFIAAGIFVFLWSVFAQDSFI